MQDEATDRTDPDAGPADFGDAHATFGDRLAHAREEAGVRRKALAKQLGIKPATLDDWENDRSAPRANRLTMLAGMLNVPLIWLMTGQGAGPTLGDDGDAGAADADRLAALLADLASARADLVSVNRRLAGIERRLRRQVSGA